MRSAIHAIAGAGPDEAVLDASYVDAMRGVLRDDRLDAAFKELVLTLPSETYIGEQLSIVDPQRVHRVREAMRLQLATALQPEWEQAYELNHDTGAYKPDPLSAGRRALAGMALTHLCLAAVASGGDLLITWSRRSRNGWPWRDGVDVPLGEEQEGYQVTLRLGDGGERVVDCQVPQLTLAAGTWGSGAVTIAVRQRGTFGLSPPATIQFSQGEQG